MKTARIAVPFYRQWYGFIGTPDMAGYTISADVMGEQVRDNLPNMGVTGASLYSCSLLATNRNFESLLGMLCHASPKKLISTGNLTPGTD
jgi:hypothetical protein